MSAAVPHAGAPPFIAQPCSSLHVREWLRGSLPLVTSTDLSLHVRFQDNCVVVLCIVGAIHQCDSATASGFEDRLQSFGFCVQFTAVASLKLCPFGWIMSKPLAKPGAGSHVLEPGVEQQGVLLYAARPESLDQKANTIVTAGKIVSTLKLIIIPLLSRIPSHGFAPAPAALVLCRSESRI